MLVSALSVEKTPEHNMRYVLTPRLCVQGQVHANTEFVPSQDVIRFEHIANMLQNFMIHDVVLCAWSVTPCPPLPRHADAY